MRPRLILLENRLAPSISTIAVSNALAGQASATGGGFLGAAPTGNYVPLFPPRHLSADGRYAVFSSGFANLISGQVDHNNTYDVFLYDRVLDEATLVSRAAGTVNQTANQQSLYPTISADGRFVAFSSDASDLVSGVSSALGTTADYVFDRISGMTTLVSHVAGNATLVCNKPVGAPVISADGLWVTYSSGATNLINGFVAGSTNNFPNLYLYDVSSGTNTLVTHLATSSSKGTDIPVSYPILSQDGRYLSYFSGSLAVVPGQSGVMGNSFIFDRLTGTTDLVTHPAGGPATTGIGGMAIGISADGRFLAVNTSANTLMPGFVDGNGASAGDLFRVDRQTGTVALVSHVAGTPNVGTSATAAFDNSGMPVMSLDGNRIVLASAATDYVAGMTDDNGSGSDVFIWNGQTGSMTLVSQSTASPNQSGNQTSSYAGLSGDGRLVTYYSNAADLLPGYVPPSLAGTGGVFAYDYQTGVTRLVGHSLTSATEAVNYPGISTISPSDDGKWVGVAIGGSEVTLNDTNDASDVFLWSADSGNLTLASPRRGAPSVTAGSESTQAQVSKDGRFVAYTSNAVNIVPGQQDSNYATDIFLYDRQTATTLLVSHTAFSLTTTANQSSSNPVISGDGRYVTYCSWATDLVAGFVDNNGLKGGNYLGTDVYLFDRVTGVNTLVSHRFDSPTSGGNKVSGVHDTYDYFFPTISDDGKYVGFRSQATDLVSGFVDGNSYDVQGTSYGTDLYLFDRITGANALINHIPGSTTNGSNAESTSPRLSGDGMSLVYNSPSINLISGLSGGGAYNIWVYNTQTGTNELISHVPGSPTTSAGGDSEQLASLSPNGRFVQFTSLSSNLVAGVTDTSANDDVFVYDRVAGASVLVTHTDGNPLQAANAGSIAVNGISNDGRFVTYYSAASDLVSGFVDQNGASGTDVYLWDRATNSNLLVSHAVGSSTFGGTGTSEVPVLSNDGRFVAWQSGADNLVLGYVPSSAGLFGRQDFLFDRLTSGTTLITHVNGSPTQASNGYAYNNPSFDAGGSVLTFENEADNLVAGDFNTVRDVFAYVTPPPQVASLQINDGSVQRSIVRSMTVTFDEPVFFSGDPVAAFTLTRSGSVGSVQLAVGNISSNPNTSITLTFSGPLTQFGSLVDGKYSLTIDAAQVSNIAHLDGTGAGVAGVNWVSADYAIYRLFGDANGDHMADGADFMLFKQAFNSFDFAFDLDGDGFVSVNDFIKFRSNFGHGI
jgi:WD40-like Beta Propeller Repeat